MILQPLLAASPVVQAHAFAAIAAFVIGFIQIAGPKGTVLHKMLGALWIALMFLIAVTSIFIGRPVEAGDPLWAHFSPIHLFTVLTFVSLTIGLRLLIGGGPQMKHHSRPFIGLFVGGLIVAGVLAFALPGRIMHEMAFGG